MAEEIPPCTSQPTAPELLKGFTTAWLKGQGQATFLLEMA